MKVYLLKNILNVGIAGEVVKVKEGYALNFLIPRKLAQEVTKNNEAFFKEHAKVIENRKEVVNSKTSMLAEKIKAITVTLKKKTHNDGKLYGAVNSSEIADALVVEGISIAKSKIKIEKSIKEKGTFEVKVKLTSQLQPKLRIKVLPDYAGV